MNTSTSPEQQDSQAAVAEPAETPQKPNLPPIPTKPAYMGSATPAYPVKPAAASAPAPLPKTTEDPTWWRKGVVPYLVLILAAAAADLYWVRDCGLGMGAGIAGILLTLAILLLRKDLSRGETLFLTALAIINGAALLVSGSMLNYFLGIIVPIFLLALPSSLAEPESTNVQYRSWWGYWTARRPKPKSHGKAILRNVMPTVISVLVGAALFIAFLTIFASGNPFVAQIREWIVTKWNEMLVYLNISWDFMWHLVYWFVGLILFGIYARRRPYMPTVIPATRKAPAGTTLLPHLPLFALIGINLAFLVATSTDIAYLWFKNIPEGISQTAYLHEGADSIIWAAILAALVLIILFRSTGIARQSIAAKGAAYILIIQTFLLAASVYLRLFYQISDYGFTFRRILAGELLLLGLVGLVILVFYIATEGRFWRCAKVCLGIMLLLVIAGGIITPSRLAATLNMQYIAANPHWKFDSRDFGYGRFDTVAHLAFAEMVYRQSPNATMARSLIRAAEKIVRENAEKDGWMSYTMMHNEDLPVAERILQDFSIWEMADWTPAK